MKSLCERDISSTHWCSPIFNDLTPEEEARLHVILEASEELRTIYLLKEEFRIICDKIYDRTQPDVTPRIQVEPLFIARARVKSLIESPNFSNIFTESINISMVKLFLHFPGLLTQPMDSLKCYRFSVEISADNALLCLAILPYILAFL